MNRHFSRRLAGRSHLCRLALPLLAVVSAACGDSSPVGPSDGGAGGAGGATTGSVQGSGGAPGSGGGSGGAVASGGTGGQPTSGSSCTTLSRADGVLQSCGRTLGLSFSPDGKVLAAVGDMGAPGLRLWQLGDGAALNVAGPSTGEIEYAVAFSPDGSTVTTAVAAGADGSAKIRVYDLGPGGAVLERALAVNAGAYASSVAFAHASATDRLAVAGSSGAVELWRPSDWTRLVSIPAPTTVHNLHFSPDDRQLIVASVDRKARIFDVATGALVADTVEVASEMADADFSPDGRQLAATWQPEGTGAGGNEVRLWDVASGQIVQRLVGHALFISHVVWLDGDRLVSNDWAGGIFLWARDASGTFAATRTWSTGGQSLAIAVSPDRTRIVAGGGAAGQEGFVFLSL